MSVIAHEQHIERHVLAVAHQLIFAAAVFQAASRQQIERAIGEAAAFLNGDFQAHGIGHHVGATHSVSGALLPPDSRRFPTPGSAPRGRLS